MDAPGSCRGRFTDDKNLSTHNHEGRKAMKHDGIFGGVYGLAFIGAAIYFIQHAATFWGGVFGFFKGLFWPAILMYKVLEILKM
jgi:hypothetical protein